MEHTKDEINQYRFIKYVETAVIRKQRRFIEKAHVTEVMESPVDSTESVFQEVRHMDTIEYPENEYLELIAWDAEAIKTFFISQMEPEFSKNIKSLTSMELQVLYAKVFLNLSYKEIGKILEIPWEKISMINSYARKKMRKGWKKNGIYRIVKSGKEW